MFRILSLFSIILVSCTGLETIKMKTNVVSYIGTTINSDYEHHLRVCLQSNTKTDCYELYYSDIPFCDLEHTDCNMVHIKDTIRYIERNIVPKSRFVLVSVTEIKQDTVFMNSQYHTYTFKNNGKVKVNDKFVIFD